MRLSPQVREQLAADNETFRRLHEEHQALEERLGVLQHKFGLSTDEELEEKRLKKQKLQLKDQMSQLAEELAPSAGNA